jgi:3-methyladenine DNA glycosylase AlkD
MPSRTQTIARSLNKAVARSSVPEILDRLKAMGSEKNRRKMEHFGVNVEKAFGVSVPNLRKLAKEIGKNHELSLQLWETGYHEARLLAALIAEPEEVKPRQMERWVKDFDSWDVCDGVCGNLFDRTPYGYKKAITWGKRSETFEKRAGFALMAYLALHNKKMPDRRFESFFPTIKGAANDERNFVKKAVSWALRQIGKRSPSLNRKAIAVARSLQKLKSPAAQWIARDALKELTGTAVQKRLLQQR